MPVVTVNTDDWCYADTATIVINSDTSGTDDAHIDWSRVQYYTEESSFVVQDFHNRPTPNPKNLREALGEPDWEL